MIFRVKISLFFLFVVAIIGTLLRSTYLVPIPLQYNHLVHAHSHVAFQGWVYLILFLLLTRMFLSKDQIRKGRYSLQFGLTVLVVIGVLISFSLQGYALYSILFSTLFQLLNYWFIYCFIRDVKGGLWNRLDPIALRFVKTGLILGLLSTLVPLAVGILSARGMAETELYHSLIYTFLHLQYNGWFLFVAVGLLYQFLKVFGDAFDAERADRFYWLFTIAVVPAIALSLLGMSCGKYLYIPAALAGTIQVIGLFYFLRSLNRKTRYWFNSKTQLFKLLFVVFLICFSLKTLLQGLSAFPAFESYAFHNKFIVLSYLHLSLLGVISFLLLALVFDLKWISLNLVSKLGAILLVLGFLSTEIMLPLIGLGTYYSPEALSAGSASMALGVLMLLLTPTDEKQ